MRCLCESRRSTRLLLFEICIYLSLLLLELVDHLRIKAHALDHVLAFLITVLVVKFFDQLKKVVVDLRLVSFRDRFLLLSIDSDLGLEKSLWVWPLLNWWAAGSLCSKLLQSTLRKVHHSSIRSLLLDRDYNFAITLLATLWYKLWPSLVVLLLVLRSVGWCVQICFALGLVLHFELSEQCLLKLSLLRRAYGLSRHLTRDRLAFCELIKEHLLVVIISVYPLLGIVSTVCALMLQVRVVRGAVLVELARAIVSTILALARVVSALSTAMTLLLKHAEHLGFRLIII